MENKISLKEKIVKKLNDSDTPLHIKEIAQDFVGIPESTIRGRLNENVGSLFERIGKGLYVLKGEKSTIGLINGDARNLQNTFSPESIDLIISDHAWLDEKSHTGGTRKFANYDCFKYEQNDFDEKYKVLKEGCFLVEFLPEKNENNRKYLREIEDMAEKAGKKDVIQELMRLENNLNIPSNQYIDEYVNEKSVESLEDYKEYLENLKVGNSEFNINKIDSFIKSKEFKELEKQYNNSGFKYFCEVAISGGNSNIGRKKKLVSTAYFFTKGDSRKLKIWDEKLAREIKEGKFKYLKDEYRVDFKKVYSEVLDIQRNDFNVDRRTNNFDFRITKDEAEYILENMEEFTKFGLFDIMCKEYGTDSDWVGINSDDLEDGKLDGDYKTFDIFLNYEFTHNKYYFIDYLDALRLNNELECNNAINGLEQGNFITDVEYNFIKSTFSRFEVNENYSCDYYNDNGEKKIFELRSKDGDLINSIEIILAYDDFGNKTYFINYIHSEIKDAKNEKLRESFMKQISHNELPQFKKYNKVLGKIQELYHLEKNNNPFTQVQENEYKDLKKKEQDFHKAFEEYIKFLQKEDSYKMGTKTILPEIYMGDLSNLREESQKPQNVLEDIILQTTNSGETVLDQYGRSFIGAEAIIKIGEDGKGWRDYFSFEIDKEIFDKNVKVLKEKYNNFKFYTYTDFFNEIETNVVDEINNSSMSKSFQLIKASIDKINEDLQDIITIDLIDFNIIDENEKIIASNMGLSDQEVILQFQNKRTKNKENKVLKIIVNKTDNIFDVVNQKGEKVNRVYDLQEGLIKMYNTFR